MIRGSWVLAAFGVLGVANACWSGSIDPALQEALNVAKPSDLLWVGFTMTSHLDMNSLSVDGLSRRERRAAIVNALKAHAAASQASMLQSMSSPQSDHIVQGIGSVWLGNSIYAHANAAAIYVLAGRSDVSRASLIQTADTPDHCQPGVPHVPGCSDCCPSPNDPCDPPCWHCVPIYSEPEPCNGFPSFPPIISWAISWVDADDVWAQGYKGDGVSIGYVDNGFDYMHPDLVDNHLLNYADRPGNGDEDGNGRIDDYYGWNFTTGLPPPNNENNDPFEAFASFPGFEPCVNVPSGGTAGHGTATLSVAVGSGRGDGSSQQFTGVAPHAWFVPIKSGNPDYDRSTDCGEGSSSSGGTSITRDALAYALDRNVDLVLPETQEVGLADFRITADELLFAELLIVAPAGNYGSVNYVTGPGFVPSPWTHPMQRDQEPSGRPSGVLTVGSLLECSDTKRPDSGYGPVEWSINTVGDEYPQYWDYATNGLIKPDVMAPGQLNLSAASSNGCYRLHLSGKPGYPNDAIYNSTGETSGATPVVAGVALLMLCKDNDLTPAEIDSLIETTASHYPIKDDQIGSGTINALAAVNATEFFNHFDGMFNDNPTTHVLEPRSAEATHWLSHLEPGTPAEQWRFVDVNPHLVLIDGVLEGEAPLAKPSLTTVHHERNSYRMDFDFVVKSFPTGGGHLTPITGAAVRFDRSSGEGLYIITRKPSASVTHVIILRKQSGDPPSGIVIAQANLTWDWVINASYSWHIWDDGGTITLTADRPGVSGALIFNHVPYSCAIAPTTKGLLVEDGTRVQFDNVRIEGFQPVSLTQSGAISRYITFPAAGNGIGACPENLDVAAHPGGITDLGQPGDYWIEVFVRDAQSRTIKDFWDLKLDLNNCVEPHTPDLPAPPARYVYSDGPTDDNGRTVFRSSLAFGGNDACSFKLYAGGQELRAYQGLRNIDLNGDSLTAIQDLSEFQIAFVSGNPALRYRCDLDLNELPCNPYCCSIGDLAVFNSHFQEPDHERTPRGKPSEKEVAHSEQGTELYWSVMDRIPLDAPIPVVPPEQAVTTVTGVGPRGRDLTIGLYAVGYSELAGIHVRCRWPEGWTLLAVGDSLVAGQIFAHPDRYSLMDRSYISAFRCLSGATPIAIGRFDVHANRDGEVAFDTENALVQIVDCRVGVRNLVEERPWGASGVKKEAVAATVPATTRPLLSRTSPAVSNVGAEFALTLGAEARVTATLYDVSGRVVMKIVDGEIKRAGTHALHWDGTAHRGGQAASGVYLLEVVVGNMRLTETVVKVR